MTLSELLGDIKLIDNKLKKIIAREGLVLSGILFMAAILFFVDVKFRQTQISHPIIDVSLLPDKPNQYTNLSNVVYNKWQFLLFFGYPLYLFIRFILWDIRTVKLKGG